MTITTSIQTSYKKELYEALHDFNASGGNVFKLALFTSAVTLNAATTIFTVTNEVSGTGYTSGGGTLTNIDPANGGTKGFIDFVDLVFSTATITTAGCQIYNSTNGGRSVQVHDFGGDKSSSAADFTIQFPVADSTNAIQRLA